MLVANDIARLKHLIALTWASRVRPLSMGTLYKEFVLVCGSRTGNSLRSKSVNMIYDHEYILQAFSQHSLNFKITVKSFSSL